jgi:hypothetical protein
MRFNSSITLVPRPAGVVVGSSEKTSGGELARAPDGHLLLLATGELGRRRIGTVAKFDEIEQLAGARCAALLQRGFAQKNTPDFDLARESSIPAGSMRSLVRLPLHASHSLFECSFSCPHGGKCARLQGFDRIFRPGALKKPVNP